MHCFIKDPPSPPVLPGCAWVMPWNVGWEERPSYWRKLALPPASADFQWLCSYPWWGSGSPGASLVHAVATLSSRIWAHLCSGPAVSREHSFAAVLLLVPNSFLSPHMYPSSKQLLVTAKLHIAWTRGCVWHPSGLNSRLTRSFTLWLMDQDLADIPASIHRLLCLH